MGSSGFERHDRLSIEGELRIEFALDEWQDDRIMIGAYDLHDLVASQFADGAGQTQRLGKFRVVMERIG